MIGREEVEELRNSKETARVERTISTSDMDKFEKLYEIVDSIE